MGLDVTHDCWSGGYSSFNLWRGEIALVIGVPLDLMEGFYRESDDPIRTLLLVPPPPDFIIEALERRIFRHLPLSWDILKPDPLHILLNHSDCDGIIEVKDCLAIAERLEAIVDKLPDATSSYRIDMRAKARQFAEGLRRAHEASEDVEFL